MSTLYELAGGPDALHRLAHAFYARVFADDLLTPLFHEPGADHHADRLGMWLVELCGGPPEHTTHRGGFVVMRESHRNLRISEAQRQRWVQLMDESAEALGLPEEFRRRFRPFLDGGSTFALRVSHPGAA
jgi:truncated hemoglobin YjbI